MKKVSVFLFVVVFVSSAFGDSIVVGKISSLRFHTSAHNTTTVVGHTTFKISASLEPPCTTLYIDPEDKTAVSFLLAAKAQEKEIKVYYQKGVFSPWSNITCSVYAVDIP